MLYCLVLLCFHARLFVDALWSPAGKELTSLLSFMMSNCDVVTFPLVSWVVCGVSLYRFLIFAFFLTLVSKYWLAHSYQINPELLPPPPTEDISYSLIVVLWW